MSRDKNRVCPMERAGGLESGIRRLAHQPHSLLAPFVKDGMTALDFGCGPGFFTLEMARLVGTRGKVVAVDLQDGMLRKVGDKIRGTELESRVSLVRCTASNIGVAEPVDFILAFYVVHEVPDADGLFAQMKSILVQGGSVLVVEPKLFHVSRSDFETTLARAGANGFASSPGPRVRLSRSAVLQHVS
jgi:ubiquinone/menaquinone biosynthesis C-methylase UbiE